MKNRAKTKSSRSSRRPPKLPRGRSYSHKTRTSHKSPYTAEAEYALRHWSRHPRPVPGSTSNAMLRGFGLLSGGTRDFGNYTRRSRKAESRTPVEGSRFYPSSIEDQLSTALRSISYSPSQTRLAAAAYAPQSKFDLLTKRDVSKSINDHRLPQRGNYWTSPITSAANMLYKAGRKMKSYVYDKASEKASSFTRTKSPSRASRISSPSVLSTITSIPQSMSLPPVATNHYRRYSVAPRQFHSNDQMQSGNTAHDDDSLTFSSPSYDPYASMTSSSSPSSSIRTQSKRSSSASSNPITIQSRSFSRVKDYIPKASAQSTVNPLSSPPLYASPQSGSFDDHMFTKFTVVKPQSVHSHHSTSPVTVPDRGAKLLSYLRNRMVDKYRRREMSAALRNNKKTTTNFTYKPELQIRNERSLLRLKPNKGYGSPDAGRPPDWKDDFPSS